MKFTKDQQAAIDLVGSDLLVAAAAGSGKTAVLVQRIIKIITNAPKPVDIDRLLVVTFTNAAATEMKQKIRAAIVEKIAQDPGNMHLKNQLTLINKATITTIHSFCREVIISNFNEINLDPAFRIADDMETIFLKTDALTEVLEEKYEEANEAFFNLVESYSENTSDNRLADLILDIYDFTQSAPWPAKWLETAVERFKPGAKDCFGETIKNQISTELYGILESACEAFSLTQLENGPSLYAEAVASDIDMIKDIQSSMEHGLDAVFEKLGNLSFARLSGKKQTCDEHVKNQVKAIRENQVKERLKALSTKFCFKSFSDMLADMHKMHPILDELKNVVLDFSKRYTALKRERQLVDFNDLEYLCLSVLLDENEQPTDAAKKLKDRYEQVMVDEYQDSNMIQELILSAVANSEKPNRFMVGDIKQSIYKFRLSRPEIFMEKYESFGTVEDDLHQKKIVLAQNFRSRDVVINFVNFLFEQIMSKDVGEVTYDEQSALYAGREFPEASNLEPEIIVVKSEVPEAAGDETEEIGNIELEAAAVAKRIAKLVADGVQVCDNGEMRRVKFSDIVILLRTVSNWSEIFTEQLTKHDIPAYAEEKKGYFQAIEVLTVLNIVKIIDNPYQDIALIAALRSPIFNVSDDELAQIRLLNAENSFYENVVEYSRKNDKINIFMENLNRWRDASVFLSVSELITQIYADTNYYDYLGVLQGGVVRQANLDILIEKAVEFERTSYKGLFNFIKYIERIQKNKIDLGAAKTLSENENLVRIMSIHKSKGLEFPVVFVCGLGKTFNMQDLRKPMLLHQDLGLGPNFIDFENRMRHTTLARSVIERQMLRENLSEEIRVLYVALTRAKEKLILTGVSNKFDDKLAGWGRFLSCESTVLPAHYMLQAKSYLDFVMPAILRHKAACKFVGADDIVANQETFNHCADFKIAIKDRTELGTVQQSEKLQDQADGLPKFDANYDYSGFADEIERRLSYEYAQKSVTNVPFKLSVTEFKRIFGEDSDIQMPETIMFREPNFSGRAISNVKKGTIMHTVMEHLQLDKTTTCADVLQLVETLINRGFITEEEAMVVDAEAVVRFAQSGLAGRIKCSENVMREMPFVLGVPANEIYPKTTDDNIIIHGIIDLFFEENGENVIVDYKTDYVPPGMADAVANKYKLQLNLYKKAVEQITGKKVSEVVVYLLSSGDCVSM